MAQYKKIGRPSAGWIAGRAAASLLLLSTLYVLGGVWPPALPIATMCFSTMGAMALLAATWSSIKTREQLCLLTLSREDAGDFADVLADMQAEVDRRVFDDLRREWKCNIFGVICLLLAVATFLLESGQKFGWM